MHNQESKEMLSDNKLLQKAECSIKKSVKPLIEMISKCPTTSKDSEQTVEQKEIKEQSHNSQTTSHYQQKDVSIIYNNILYVYKTYILYISIKIIIYRNNLFLCF